ncbi:exported hypothetical protein [Planktothrix sp. PCC 11201]|uniref:hypothetical protein n=1 Tax=Planktothrix sp. PCC 11201 TaxID=1729650 RepID=UPI00091ACB0F|nr:hypothetical protein [Planktothrix sp. PCC 11201]SKB15720.1 exported hypothetical protein [Planktothrix sp. PCC 11201]
MLTNPRKKYTLILALSLAGVLNATPGFANPQGVSSSHLRVEPLSPGSIKYTPNHKSILTHPEQRRTSECIDNGLCYRTEQVTPE